MRDPHRIYATLTTTITVVLLGIFLNVALHMRPTLFGHQLGNYMFSRYGTKAGDIYYEVPDIGIHLMWPDFRARAYYNGYFWDHRTDALGFRNPPGRGSDVVLLGDSMIYGHGVEVGEGVSEVLHDRHGWETYNLSQQGDCLFQSVVKGHLYFDTLRPRVAIHFAFENDVLDLEIHRTLEQIEAAPELSREDWPEVRARIDAQASEGGREAWLAGWPVVRFLRGLPGELIARMRGRAPDAPVDPVAVPLLDPERRARAERYYERALADLAARTRANGGELVVVHLDARPGGDPRARTAFRELVRGAAERTGVRFYTTGDALLDCADCALPEDLHPNARGHALLAEQVDGWLREILGPETPAG